MGRLGIITCEILELEFAHLLAADKDVAGVTVLADARSENFIEALRRKAVPNVRLIPHVASYMPEPSEHLDVIVRAMELGLHRSKQVLRDAIAEAARGLHRHVDALLLGYGLCGNALEKFDEFLGIDIPVVVPMDGDHAVDDCVGMLIGGRECYYAEQCKVPGTFFMTPGWTRHTARLQTGDRPGADSQASKRLFAEYKRCLLVRTPVVHEEEMRPAVDKFAASLGLRVETCDGSINLLERAWDLAKAHVRNTTHNAAHESIPA